MSERIHSPSEPTPEATTADGAQPIEPAVPVESAMPAGPAARSTKRPVLREKLLLVAGGAACAAVLTIAAFQFLRQDSAAAQDRQAEAAQQAAERAAQLRQRPLARVGRQVVNYDAVADECFMRYGDEVLENVINRLTIQQACEDRGVEVTNEEVDEEVLRIAQKFNLTPENWYKMLHAERNLTPLQYRRDVIWPMIALKKLAGNTVDVTQQDLQKAFESAYGPRVQVKMIMLDNFRHAENVWTEAKKSPDDFERLAQQHSIEPNSRALGGTVPPIRKHVGNDEVVKRAFAMKTGEISPVVQVAPGRYVILKCEGFTEPVVKQMTQEVRDELYNALLEEKTQEAVAQVFDEVKKQVRVDNYLKGTVNGGVQQSSATAPATPVPTSPTPGSAAPGTSNVRQAVQQQPARQ